MSKIRKIKRKNNEANEIENTEQDLSSSTTSIKHFFIILLSIIGVSSLGYAVMEVWIFDGGDGLVDNDKKEFSALETDMFAKIAVDDTLKQSNDNYYVFYLDNTSQSTKIYEDYLNKDASTVENSKPKLPAYYANMSETINSSFTYDWKVHNEEKGPLADADINLEPAMMEDVTIAYYPTLIEVKEGKIVGFYDDEKEIKGIIGLSE